MPIAGLLSLTTYNVASGIATCRRRITLRQVFIADHVSGEKSREWLGKVPIDRTIVVDE